jgi:hypothetical protein
MTGIAEILKQEYGPRGYDRTNAIGEVDLV